MRTVNSSNLDESFFCYKEPEELKSVKNVISDIKKNGDKAVKLYTKKFDGVELDNFKISELELNEAVKKVNKETMLAIEKIASNIKNFSIQQIKQFKNFEYEIEPGVFTGQKVIPINRVCVYVPGGEFPLISTLLMCAIPAKTAGVKEIIVCSPPTSSQTIHPAVLAAAHHVNINEIYSIGGIQAVAACAFGTKSIKKVDKIVGPGNKYVTQAKKELYGTVGIDFIAGPSEVMVIADKNANSSYVAADLIAQAEHDKDAESILITDSREFSQSVEENINNQLEKLPKSNRDNALASLKNNGLIIIVSNLEKAIEIANKKAPEHLEIQYNNAENDVSKYINYGSLFIGKNAAEVFGDYSSGINHTLPTNLSARYTGGLSVKDFVKLTTTLRVNDKSIKSVAKTAKIMADAEGLKGHANAAELRYK